MMRAQLMGASKCIHCISTLRLPNTIVVYTNRSLGNSLYALLNFLPGFRTRNGRLLTAYDILSALASPTLAFPSTAKPSVRTWRALRRRRARFYSQLRPMRRT